MAKHRAELFGLPIWLLVIILLVVGLIASLFIGVIGWALGFIGGFFLRWVF